VSNLSLLKEKSLIIVFSYAPAGLGHLRVSNALSGGLPQSVTPLLIGSHDEATSSMHKFMSIHSYTRALMEWAQVGIQEDIFAFFYRRALMNDTDELYEQIAQIFDQRIDVPKEILFVATHFGLGLKIAAIKNKLESEKGVKVHLIVQVTDDSPQHMWYVNGADLTFVPSEKTKTTLLSYGKRMKYPHIDIQILPYPISLKMSDILSDAKLKQREKQLDPNAENKINMALPVSGAAVGMDFYKVVMNSLHNRSKRFTFHVVSKNAPFTQYFLFTIATLPYARLYTSIHEREVVDLYEDLYVREVISLEITKPSEQAFKSLYSSKQVGGSVILFSQPVGRQEYDNLDFMRRHNLIFPKHETRELMAKFERGAKLTKYDTEHLFGLRDSIRGLEIPTNPHKAAAFIWWCFENELLLNMHNHSKTNRTKSLETLSNGVELFWQQIENYLQHAATSLR